MTDDAGFLARASATASATRSVMRSVAERDATICSRDKEAPAGMVSPPTTKAHRSEGAA